MKIHVLPGDALAERFRESGIEGRVVICRECLIEGATEAPNLEDFWKVRAEFIREAYGEGEDSYREKVVGEFAKLENLSPDAEVNLWFEHELFCQANMWFCLFLLRKSEATVYRVAPIVNAEKDFWRNFDAENKEDLQKSFAARVRFTKKDISLGANLWKAYQSSDFDALKTLSEIKSAPFPYLKEVCLAEIEKNYRPKKTLSEITEKGTKDFTEVFQEFSLKEKVYGYGDAQVKRIMRAI